MIQLYCGKVGGGKSYSAVFAMLKALGMGRVVASNIGLDWQAACKYCKRHYGYEPVSEQYIFLADDDAVYGAQRLIPPGSLLVLDEMNIYFPARGYKQNAERSGDFLGWLVQSRKYQCDVIAIIQSPANLDAQIRRQAQVEWHHVDTKAAACSTLWGFGPSLKIGLLAPRMFRRVQFWAGDYTEEVSAEFLAFDKEVGACYQTNAIFKAYYMASGRVIEPPKPSAWVRVRRHAALFMMLTMAFGGVGCAFKEKAELKKLIGRVDKQVKEYDALILQAKSQVQNLQTVMVPGADPALPGADPALQGADPALQGASVVPDSLVIEGRAGDMVMVSGCWIAVGERLPFGGVLAHVQDRRLIVRMSDNSLKTVPYRVAAPDSI